MTDPSQPDQPSEEEIRAYLAQIREADPTAIIVQAFQMLGEGAQIKLGRSDARVLIDTMGAVSEAVAGRVPADLTEQMRTGVAQLQTAQVQAEREQGAAAPSAAGDPTASGTSDASGMPPGSPTTSSPQQDAEEKLTDRLWIPGRGPKPGP